jgi:hypothetical protein
MPLEVVRHARVERPLEVELGEERTSAREHGVRREAVEPAEVDEVLAPREERVHAVLRGDEPDRSAPCRGDVVRWDPCDLDATGRGTHEAGEQQEERALPASVRTDDAEHLARGERESRSGQHGGATERSAELHDNRPGTGIRRRGIPR